jgi:hypothetical protein
MNSTHVAAHRDLFILDFVRRPEILREQGLASGITEPFVCEITAWCAELGEQLQTLSGELGIDLLLMGGNGASLRFDAIARPAAGARVVRGRGLGMSVAEFRRVYAAGELEDGDVAVDQLVGLLRIGENGHKAAV